MSRPSGTSRREEFERSRPYGLDAFQKDAMDLLDGGHSVLVTAPTGSGKTVVAEYAVHLAVTEGSRAFYTTPLKALSNQKYADLVATYGEARVGLLTGDNSINPQAPVVVMTTEVLRNMIHGGRASLFDLGYVVLDEVHFLEDPYRGGVWEEVILGAPPEVRLVCLSATVANADELAAWLAQVRGGTEVVSETRRPVVLHDLFAIGERSSRQVHLLPVFLNGRPNKEAMGLDELMGRSGPRSSRGRQGYGRPQGRTYRPRRSDMLERLHRAELLPAIYFVFSRAGCEQAVRALLEENIRLTTPTERDVIRQVVEDHVEALSDSDLSVLGYGRFLDALEHGIASHHAGMVPPFREAVEALFKRALVKIVFATETLALGINMPARSVVIEEITKYSGAGHVELTPGEYTQLTGRAGRRGIDEVGYGIVLASPFYGFGDVARLAGSPGRDLTSSFRPTYNLAVSLVRRFDRQEAYRIVSSSFAQWLSEEDLADQLTRVIDLLGDLGYLSGWRVTERGELLAGLYNEADLLIAECLSEGLFDGLDPASLAAVASGFTYETRRERDGGPPPPKGRAAERLRLAAEVSERLGEEEAARRLPLTRGVDSGFAQIARRWASGEELWRVLSPPRGSGRGPGRQLMTGGDFVRNAKQLIDLLGQIALVAADEETRSTASRASSAVRRGVVAASSQIYLAPPAEGSWSPTEREVAGGEASTPAERTAPNL